MKTSNFVTLITLVSAFGSTFAQASDAAVEVQCHSRNVADAGYSVVVENLGRGKRVATVFENSFRGQTEIGKVRVSKREKDGTLVYRGVDLKLAINLMDVNTGLNLKGELSGDLITDQQFGDMYCVVTPVSEPLPHPRRPDVTCMALWVGFAFNPETGTCEVDSRSGCSSPFEFETAEDCVAAYRLAQ